MPGAEFSRRVRRYPLHAARGHASRVGISSGGRSFLWGRSCGPRIRAIHLAMQRSPLHIHHLPGDRRLCGTVLSRHGRFAGADRFADGSHGPGVAADARRRFEDCFHRAVHCQEGRGPGSRRGRRDRRRVDVSRTAPDVQRSRSVLRTKCNRAISIRRTAASADCSQSAEAFCRPPISTKT